MATATTRQPDWTDCMAGLTGLRLAIYDTLLTTGALYVPQVAAHLNPTQRALPQIEEALKWLATHRFVGTRDYCWHAHTPAQAREVYEAHGPATIGQPKTYVTPTRTAALKTTAVTAAPERKVHHQSGLLALNFA